MGKRAFIFAAGEYKPADLSLYKRIKFNEDDLIICADGGYQTLVYTSITPDVIIGDFDSLDIKIPSEIKTITYPKQKDKTDLEICIDYAIENGCDSILLLGVLGGRVDHSLGAFFALRYAYENGAEAMILTGSARVYLVKDEIMLKRENFSYISLIPCTDEVSGITTLGLKYELNDATLKQSSSRGISNEFFNNTIKIKIDKGLLYVICTTE